MVLVKFVACVVFEITCNLVSMQNILKANNSWHKQKFENCPAWPLSIFNELSEHGINFVSNASFTWNDFSRKQGWVTMCNYVRTCKSICSHNPVYNFFKSHLPLKLSVFLVCFSNAFYPAKQSFPKDTSL